jgi:hypothetical protein
MTKAGYALSVRCSLSVRGARLLLLLPKKNAQRSSSSSTLKQEQQQQVHHFMCNGSLELAAPQPLTTTHNTPP